MKSPPTYLRNNINLEKLGTENVNQYRNGQQFIHSNCLLERRSSKAKEVGLFPQVAEAEKDSYLLQSIAHCLP